MGFVVGEWEGRRSGGGARCEDRLRLLCDAHSRNNHGGLGDLRGPLTAGATREATQKARDLGGVIYLSFFRSFDSTFPAVSR